MHNEKKDLKNKIDSFFYDKLDERSFKVETVDALDLLTYNRLDLAFKLYYLDMKEKNKDLALRVYQEDIRCQTNETFKEYGNKSKNSFKAYANEFDSIFYDIKTNGFDEKKSIIPLSKINTIENGSHRVSAAIKLNKTVTCAYLDLKVSMCDYNFYYERKVSNAILDIVVSKFIEYSKNTYIAFLWPSGKNKINDSISCFSKIIYKRQIKLNQNGAAQLLYELYKHMDWIGTEKSNFEGIQQKTVECFPIYDDFTVIVFQSDSLDSVRKIKENVRKIHNIGFSSIHITDTKEEALRISRSIFNENGLHFLNYAARTKSTSLYDKLSPYKQFLEKKNINYDDVILDTGMVLSAYGIRESSDTDFIVNTSTIYEENDIESHDNELKFHKVDKHELIYNPKYHFYFDGYKFISFNQLYRMKQNRNTKKDVNDLQLMTALIENDLKKKIIAKVKQEILYKKVRIRQSLIKVIKKLGLYNIAKNYYDKNLRK